MLAQRRVLGNQADTMIWWKFLEYFLVYKLCNSLDILIGLQLNILYSKSNQHTTRFLQHTTTLTEILVKLIIILCITIV